MNELQFRDVELDVNPMILASFSEPSNIVCSIKGEEMLRIEEDGKFYVKGNLITEDIDIYFALKDFLQQAGLQR